MVLGYDFSLLTNNYFLIDFALPFIIIFGISWFALKKTNIFKDNTRICTAIAVVIGLGVVVPHVLGMYSPGSDVVEMMKRFLPNITIAIIVMLMVMVLLGIGGVGEGWGKSIHGFIVVISIIIVALVFANAYGWVESDSWWLQWLQSPNTYSFIVMLLMFGIIMWFITRPESKIF